MSIEVESGETPEGNHYVSKTDDEVNELAKQGYRGEVFFSWAIREHDMHLLGTIFMPVLFMDEVMAKEMERDQIRHFYAPMKDAFPRSINGYPCFSSMGMLSQTDAERVHQRILQIMELLGDFKPESQNG
jgi:hypothetical protein